MIYLGWFLTVYGAFLLVGFLLQFPFLYTNPKSKALIKVMGKKGYNILLLVLGIATLVIGILIIS